MKHVCKLCQANPVHNPDTACASCDKAVWDKLWQRPSPVTVRLAAEGRRA